MTLEQEQFQRYRPDFSRLIPYGFEPTEEGYCISRELMDGEEDIRRWTDRAEERFSHYSLTEQEKE